MPPAIDSPSTSRATPSVTRVASGPSWCSPSPSPAAAMASLISTTRGPPTRANTPATVSSERCTPSAISSTVAAPSGGSGERSESGTRCAVVERRHPVEEVRDQRGCAVAQEPLGGGGGGVGVADRHEHPAVGEEVGECIGAGQLGGDRHHAHVPASRLDQRLREADVGRQHPGGVLGAAAGGGQERPLQVDRGDLARLHRVGERRDDGQHPLRVVGHGAGDHRRGALTRGGAPRPWPPPPGPGR